MVFIVNAFTKNNQGGNPAGVMLLDKDLEDRDMLNIAKEMGFSETAFVKRLSPTVFHVRFFTPVAEVDLCGHATIASFTLLKARGHIGNGEYTQITKAGQLKLKVSDQGVFMEMAKPLFFELVDGSSIAKVLGIEESDFLKNYPIQCVSTGLKDMIIPLTSLDVIKRLKPDFDKITKISRAYDVVGFHVFTFETEADGNVHVRNFAPLYAIDEEAATGTANGALTAYLHKYMNPVPRQMVFEQGYEMECPSEVISYVSHEGQLFVGGTAAEVGQKQFEYQSKKSE